MFDVAQAAVEGALAAGATYADARVIVTRTEGMNARDEMIEDLRQGESAGVGVRALLGAGWGFFATAELNTAAARRAGERAAQIARASGRVGGEPLRLAPSTPAQGEWANVVEEDPFAVSLSEKADLLLGVNGALKAEKAVSIANASYQLWGNDKWMVSSEGHRVHQRVVESGASMTATAVGDSETQRRSYPGIRGQYGTAGWELVRRIDLPGNAGRVASEAAQLVSAPQCPAGETTLILGSEQMALQIHESIGHAIELDRILGWEASYAGTSWLELPKMGTLRFGSDLLNVQIDSTLPGALGSFGYDDEGTPASSVDAIRNGIWVGVLSGRDSAPLAGLDYAGAVRCDGYDRLPMVRMTNVGMLPGEQSLDEMIASTDDGIYMDTNRSWSIDDKRLNFQFGCEVGWEIRSGRRTRLLRNPTYTGISPTFWGSMDMIGNRSEWTFWGTPNCGKGQPGQVGHTGHPAVPARFRNVRVGVRG